MATKVVDNFEYKAQKPLDGRSTVDTLAGLIAMREYDVYDGLIVYVTSEKKYYTFDSTNSEDPTTKKWRELKTGGGGGTDITPSSDPDNAFKLGSDKLPYVKDLEPEIEDLKLYKFPNATIIGQPTINNGQISGFSTANYMQFPFIVDFKGRPFVINAEFTTGSNVTNQQNIFDSRYGFAFAVRSSKFVVAMSSTGTNWDLGESVGTYTVLPNTTYRVRLSWDGNTYKLEYSTDNGETYKTDISKASTASLYPKQVYIGVGMGDTAVLNSFTGSINFNHCDLTISGKVVWQGMDDAGLATRLAVDVSNIDAAGEAKIREIAGGGTPDYDVLTNKPSINGVELTGDKTSNDLDIFSKVDYTYDDATNTLNLLANEGAGKELTSEHKTGETFGGKPVYEKVVTLNSFANTNVADLNIDSVVNIDGTFVYPTSNQIIELNGYYGSSYAGVYYQANEIRFVYSTNYSNANNIMVRLRYTKKG